MRRRLKRRGYDGRMLKLVPPSKPDARQKILQRLRADRPEGVLQCPICAGRTSAKLVNGAYRDKGRIKGGTVIYERICADCYQRERIVDMEPVRPV